MIRRSRSFSPTFIDPHNNLNSAKSILGMGAGLKSSFSFHHQNNTYISQYLGNLSSFESQESFEKVLNHYFDLFQAKPEIIITDKHPQYFSTQFGNELKEKYKTQIYEVQHHKAHFAAVLAENGKINSNNTILGIIWDGVGLGDDGNIWGGEFFSYQKKQMQRLAHFDYFQHIALDKFSKEPRLPALSLLQSINFAKVPNFGKVRDELLSAKFSTKEFVNYKKLLQKQGNLKTSSVGRLFDAVSSLLGIKDANSFEGEAAMILENKASEFYKNNKNYREFYSIKFYENKISTTSIIEQIINDIIKKKEKTEIAFKFHLTLVEIIRKIANNFSINELAFSGGVCQNSLLIDLIIRYLSEKYQLYFHKQLSASDENISYGQIVYTNNKIT